jgi:virginiamycin B lyase
MRSLPGWLLLLAFFVTPMPASAQAVVQEYDVPAGSHPHDVAPAADGGIWFTAQGAGYLGWLDPNSGGVRQVALGPHSAPHGVILGPDGAPWVTDGGQNAIVRVDPQTSEVRVFPLPGRNANLNTATFDRNGILWFTGQSGVYGRLDPSTAELTVFDAPRGPGPYGIIATPDGSRVFYASLAGSHIAEINLETAQAAPIDPPTPGQGARRVWTDSQGSIWVGEWNAGQVARFDPLSGEWLEWRLPGGRPSAYAVWVDPQDIVWLSDWGSNAIVSFDPRTEMFQQFVMPQSGSDIRELQGRQGEVWGAESGLDRIVVIRHQ